MVFCFRISGIGALIMSLSECRILEKLFSYISTGTSHYSFCLWKTRKVFPTVFIECSGSFRCMLRSHDFKGLFLLSDRWKAVYGDFFLPFRGKIPQRKLFQMRQGDAFRTSDADVVKDESFIRAWHWNGLIVEQIFFPFGLRQQRHQHRFCRPHGWRRIFGGTVQVLRSGHDNHKSIHRYVFINVFAHIRWQKDVFASTLDFDGRALEQRSDCTPFERSDENGSQQNLLQPRR